MCYWKKALLLLGMVSSFAVASEAGSSPAIRVLRVPGGGIQPQAVVDQQGVVHLIYYRGDSAHGDIYYVRSTDSGRTFTDHLRVNSRPGSAIAIGNIRGAQLAVGKNGRAHVAWMGTDKAEPGPEGASPMVYARLNQTGTAFEPEKNVMQFAHGLDGGGSVAADEAGNVYVAWHANTPGGTSEGDRTIWVAKSVDEGQAFAVEKQAWQQRTGACACCGMRAFADQAGQLYVLYRAALRPDQRDMFLLQSKDGGTTFTGSTLHPWNIEGCPMSSCFLAEGPQGVLAAWETAEQVYFRVVANDSAGITRPISPSGDGKPRKHPVLAVNSEGETLLAWTEGMRWNKPGKLCWQVFDREGRPIDSQGMAEGVPTWSLPAACALQDNSFLLVY